MGGFGQGGSFLGARSGPPEGCPRGLCDGGLRRHASCMLMHVMTVPAARPSGACCHRRRGVGGAAGRRPRRKENGTGRPGDTAPHCGRRAAGGGRRQALKATAGMLAATPDMLHNLACAHIERGEMEAALAALDEAERLFVEEVTTPSSPPPFPQPPSPQSSSSGPGSRRPGSILPRMGSEGCFAAE